MLSSLIPNAHFPEDCIKCEAFEILFLPTENWLGKNDIVPKFNEVHKKDDVVSLYFVSQDF